MTRPQRNNNPLNIRHSSDSWEGACEEQTDKAFVQFKSLAYGYRAAWKVLESYWKHFHKESLPFNVKNIIGRWAPPTENDTQAYIRTVLKLSGLGGNENLPQPSRKVDVERLERLVRAMTVVESGIPLDKVRMRAIRQGYQLAFPGRQSYARTKPVEEIDWEKFLIWDEYRDW